MRYGLLKLRWWEWSENRIKKTSQQFNIVESVNRRTNLTDGEKAEIIRKAYDAVSGGEGAVPCGLSEKGVKVIPWDDNVHPEKTATETAEYFRLKK